LKKGKREAQSGGGRHGAGEEGGREFLKIPTDYVEGKAAVQEGHDGLILFHMDAG